MPEPYRCGAYGIIQCCRTLCHTLPLHNPLILAGAIAEADLLTHGRLECGLGRGHAWLFPPASIPLAESRPRYEEALDLLTLAWTQDHFSYEGSILQRQRCDCGS